MEKELKTMTSKELIDIYNKTKEFVNYLEKEYKNVEKMRDTNE